MVCKYWTELALDLFSVVLDSAKIKSKSVRCRNLRQLKQAETPTSAIGRCYITFLPQMFDILEAQKKREIVFIMG
jgi:hypothetical protein